MTEQDLTETAVVDRPAAEPEGAAPAPRRRRTVRAKADKKEAEGQKEPDEASAEEPAKPKRARKAAKAPKDEADAQPSDQPEA